MNNLARAIRQKRMRSGLTLADVGRKLNISVTTLSNIERGAGHTPDASTLLRLSDWLSRNINLAPDGQVEVEDSTIEKIEAVILADKNLTSEAAYELISLVITALRCFENAGTDLQSME